MSMITSLEFNRYSTLPDENTTFDQDMLMRIEDLAAGLSASEIMDYFGLQLHKLNPVEVECLMTAYNRGCAKAKHKVTEKLLSAMGDKNGGVFALKYLEVFAEKFAETEAASNLNHGYTLQIVPTVSDNPRTKAINGNSEPKVKKSK